MNYDVGCFAVKVWKYILWYFVNTSIVNANILQQDKQKGSAYLDFPLEIAMGFIARFPTKMKAEAPLILGPRQLHMKTSIKMCTWAQRREKEVNGNVLHQIRKETVYGCYLCNAHLHQDGSHIA